MKTKSEKVKVTFSHENGDELVCSFNISEKGTKMDVTRKDGGDVMNADQTLQRLLYAFVTGIKALNEE